MDRFFASGDRRFETRCLWGLVLVVLASSRLAAEPPRSLADDEDAVPAAFELEVDTPRPLSPRTKTTDAPGKSSTTSKRVATQTSLWGTVIGLAVVFGLFVVGKLWLTRHGPAALRGLPVEALELLGKRTIEPKVSIHLVRCGPKILVLGVAPDGVRTLSEITDPIEIDMLAGACRKKESDRPLESFAGMFRQSASRSGGG